MGFSVAAQGTMMKSFASKIYLTVTNALFCLGTMRNSDGRLQSTSDLLHPLYQLMHIHHLHQSVCVRSPFATMMDVSCQ